MTVRTVSRPELLDADGGDTTFRGMVYDLLTVGARMQEVRDRLAREMGVTGPQYAILMAIFHLQQDLDGPGVRAVARRLHVSGPFVTAQSRVLVKEGLVEKKPNPRDGRGVWLCLTGEGSRRIARTARTIQTANDEFFGSLDSVHFLVLSDIAARLEKSSGRAVRNLPPDTG